MKGDKGRKREKKMVSTDSSKKSKRMNAIPIPQSIETKENKAEQSAEQSNLILFLWGRTFRTRSGDRFPVWATILDASQWLL